MAAASPWIVHVSEDDFDKVVIEGSKEKPVVVDFWAPWCQPCRMMMPYLEAAVNERKGEVVLAEVNVDEANNIAARYRVEGIPAVKAFRNGQVVQEFVGARPLPALRDFLRQVAPDETGRMALAARETKDPVEAERMFRQVLQKEPGNEIARVGLAALLLQQNKTAEINELLEPFGPDDDLAFEVEKIKGQLALRELARDCGTEAQAKQKVAANSNNAEALYQLGCVQAANGQYEKALENLLAAGERDPGLAKSKVKDAMVKVFYVLGVQHPKTNEYRTKLSRLLY
jgi:putative thioredoxin